MKIIKQGVPKPERIWIGECRQCGSIAEASEKELTHVEDTQRDGAFSWEVCPVCNSGNKDTGYGGMLFYLNGEILI